MCAVTVVGMGGEDRFVSVADGVRLHVRSWPGSLRPFILVHGLSSNALLWDEVADYLSDARHPVHAIDLRSHGASDAPESGYDTATAAEDVFQVAQQLGLDPAVAAGQSWGGNVVVELAARHPTTVAALALVDGGWFSPANDFPDRSAWATAARPPAIDGRRADDIRAFFTRNHPDWSPAAVDATMANLAVAADGTVARRLSIDHHMQIALDMWDSPPQRSYAHVRVPVMLVPALPSDATAASHRRERIAEAAAQLPRATIREYVGGDHDLHAQHPRDLAIDLLNLAASVDVEAHR